MVIRVKQIIGSLVLLLGIAQVVYGGEYKDLNAAVGIGKFYIETLVINQDKGFEQRLYDLVRTQILKYKPNASFTDSIDDADCMISIILIGNKISLNVTRFVKTLRGNPPTYFWATIYMVEKQIGTSDLIDSIKTDLIEFMKWLLYGTNN